MSKMAEMVARSMSSEITEQQTSIPLLEDMMHYAAFNKSAHSYLATFGLNLLVLSVALAGTVAMISLQLFRTLYAII